MPSEQVTNELRLRKLKGLEEEDEEAGVGGEKGKEEKIIEDEASQMPRRRMTPHIITSDRVVGLCPSLS